MIATTGYRIIAAVARQGVIAARPNEAVAERPPEDHVVLVLPADPSGIGIRDHDGLTILAIVIAQGDLTRALEDHVLRRDILGLDDQVLAAEADRHRAVRRTVQHGLVQLQHQFCRGRAGAAEVDDLDPGHANQTCGADRPVVAPDPQGIDPVSTNEGVGGGQLGKAAFDLEHLVCIRAREIVIPVGEFKIRRHGQRLSQRFHRVAIKHEMRGTEAGRGHAGQGDLGRAAGQGDAGIAAVGGDGQIAKADPGKGAQVDAFHAVRDVEICNGQGLAGADHVGIGFFSALNRVDAHAPGQQIKTAVAHQRIIAGAPGQDIVVCAAIQIIMARATRQHVVAGPADQHIRAVGPGNRIAPRSPHHMRAGQSRGNLHLLGDHVAQGDRTGAVQFHHGDARGGVAHVQRQRGGAPGDAEDAPVSLLN